MHLYIKTQHQPLTFSHLKHTQKILTNRRFILLNDVKPLKSGRWIQVKLIHSWKQHTTTGKDSLELILAYEYVYDMGINYYLAYKANFDLYKSENIAYIFAMRHHVFLKIVVHKYLNVCFIHNYTRKYQRAVWANILYRQLKHANI